MSTISSVIFRDNDILPVNRWIHRKRRHYKQAIDQYSAQLCELLESDTKEKLAELGSRSVDLRIDNKLLPLRGITIDRSILPNAKPGELVQLINLATEQSLTRGFVLSVSPSKVRIKLDKPLVKVQANQNEKKNQQQQQNSQDGGGQDATEQKQQVGEAAATNHEPTATNNAPSDGEAADLSDRVTDQIEQAQDDKLDVKVKFEMRGVLSRHDCVAYALHKFQKLSCSLPIHQCLLGIYNDHSDTLYEKTRVMSFSGKLPELKDKMQRLAVEQAMRRRIALVEGPAGSGKTLVAVYAACNMVRIKKRKVLLCSSVQANVSKLAKMIAQIEGINLVELTSGRQASKKSTSSTSGPKTTSTLKIPNGHNVSNSIKLANNLSMSPQQQQQQQSDYCCSLDKLVDDEIYWMAWNRSKDFFGGHVGLIHSHASRVVEGRTSQLRRRYEQKVLAKADIVCCSLLQTSEPVLDGIHFDMLIIDDVQVSKELDCIVPIMTRGVKQVLLLSDLRRNIRRFHRGSSTARSTASSPSSGNDISGDRISLANSSCSTSSAREFCDSNSVKDSSSSIITTATTTTTRTRTTNSKRSVNSPHLAKYNDALEPSNQPGGLFERWLSIGISAVVLKKQYRAHESLSLFTNHQFYLRPPQNDQENNSKLTAIIRETFKREDSWNWLPKNRCLTAIFNRETLGQTISQEVKMQVDKLAINENIDKTRIGVIVNLHDGSFDLPAGVDCGTVSDFVGQEKDFIILVGMCQQRASDGDDNNCNDQEQTHQVGGGDNSSPASIKRDTVVEDTDRLDNFLRNDNALNVALTRARLGLFIVTDLKHFTKHPLEAAAAAGDGDNEFCKSWRDLVNYYLDNNLVS